jgi:hypothetical protein
MTDKKELNSRNAYELILISKWEDIIEKRMEYRSKLALKEKVSKKDQVQYFTMLTELWFELNHLIPRSDLTKISQEDYDTIEKFQSFRVYYLDQNQLVDSRKLIALEDNLLEMLRICQITFKDNRSSIQ